jgi:hypothetical protein
MKPTDKFLRFYNKRKVKNETNHRAVEASCAGCGAPEIEHKIESARERKRGPETQKVSGGGGGVSRQKLERPERLFTIYQNFLYFSDNFRIFLSSHFLFCRVEAGMGRRRDNVLKFGFLFLFSQLWKNNA